MPSTNAPDNKPCFPLRCHCADAIAVAACPLAAGGYGRDRLEPPDLVRVGGARVRQQQVTASARTRGGRAARSTALPMSALPMSALHACECGGAVLFLLAAERAHVWCVVCGPLLIGCPRGGGACRDARDHGLRHVGLPSRWVYPATKAAIEQVTRSQAMDLAEFGIRVNAVMPGWTAKPWQLTAPKETQEQYAYWGNRLHMLGRVGKMEEGTDAVLFRCSEHAGFMTGSCLRVDGGHSAMGPQGREVVLPTTLRKGTAAAQPK